MIRSIALLPLCVILQPCGGPPARPATVTESASPRAAPQNTPEPPAPPPPSVAVVAPSAAASATRPGESTGAFAHRCGWIDNPTPANWWLTDRDGEWEIGIQGGHQARGDMPDFGANWVETNVHYGYGCACMNLRADRDGKHVTEYRQVQVLPLDRCRRDATLPRR